MDKKILESLKKFKDSLEELGIKVKKNDNFWFTSKRPSR